MNTPQKPGSMEILATTAQGAIEFARVEYSNARQIPYYVPRESDDAFHAEFPDFALGYTMARDYTERCGYLLRKEMPVVNEEDLPAFKDALTRVDIRDFCDVCEVRHEFMSPIQKQIYVDKAVGATARNGFSRTESFLRANHIVLSVDNMIVDGHHRWLTGMVMRPSMEVPVFRARVPLNDLFPIVMAFSRARGNSPNL